MALIHVHCEEHLNVSNVDLLPHSSRTNSNADGSFNFHQLPYITSYLSEAATHFSQ